QVIKIETISPQEAHSRRLQVNVPVDQFRHTRDPIGEDVNVEGVAPVVVWLFKSLEATKSKLNDRKQSEGFSDARVSFLMIIKPTFPRSFPNASKFSVNADEIGFIQCLLD